MACFLALMTEAVVVTVIKKNVEKKERVKAEQQLQAVAQEEVADEPQPSTGKIFVQPQIGVVGQSAVGRCAPAGY